MLAFYVIRANCQWTKYYHVETTVIILKVFENLEILIAFSNCYEKPAKILAGVCHNLLPHNPAYLPPFFRSAEKVFGKTIACQSHLFMIPDRLLIVHYPQNNHMIGTFLFPRLLNPKKMKNSQQMFVFSQRIDIYSDSIQAKSTFVVTKWKVRQGKLL